MSKPIYEVMKNLKVGEVSKPIKKTEQCIIFTIKRKKNFSKPDNLDIEKLKKDLISQKKNEII